MARIKLNLEGLVSVAGVLYPILTHWAISRGSVEWGLIFLAVVTGLCFATQLASARNPWKEFSVWLPGGGLAVLILCVVFLDSPRFALYVPPIMLITFFLVQFARTLLPGREPLISRISRLVFQDDTPGIDVYTRQLTWLWTIFLGLMLVQTLALTLFAPIEIWSLFINILNYVFILVFFVLEFIYRIYRFGSRYSVAYYAQKLIRLPIRQLFKN